ncbi:hypothetical protein L7F22_061392 [Adiantum nelumboides]|nr:hypothetical protein [Adiantum nelumboides]
MTSSLVKEYNVQDKLTCESCTRQVGKRLVKVYKFEPSRMNIQIVARILVKALMALPAPDFNLCMFLIPEKLQMEDPFLTLITLAHFLETARFREFWDEAARNRHILEVVPGFEQAIQGFALHVLSLSYQRLPRTVLAEAINMEGLSLDKFLEHQISSNGWSVEKVSGGGQLVVLPANEHNYPELKKSIVDSIPLEHVSKLFPVLT